MQFLLNLKKQHRTFILITTSFLFCTILCASVLPVRAAVFIHNHNGACYSQGQGPCTAQHKVTTRTESTTAHCGNCGTQTTHKVYVHWDRCYGNGEESEVGGYRTCNTCGAQTYSWGGSSSRTHQVTQQVLSCGKSNSAMGSLWLKNTTSGWTTEGVILKAGVDIYSSGLSLPREPYSWNGRASWSAEASKKVTENGTYTVHARNADGTVIGETIKVTNIDRTGPTLSAVEKSTTEWTNQDVVLTLRAEDIQPGGGTGCGLASQAYSYDGGITYTEENRLTVSGNGTFDVMLMDQLGNVGQEQVEVTNIDKNAPVINNVFPIQEGWQSESVIMQVQAEDAVGGSGLHASSYSLDGENWQETPEFLFVENGDYQVFVRDVVGNVASKDFTVAQVDITAPIIDKLQVDSDKILEDKVFVTIFAMDLQPDGSVGSGLHEEAYSLDGGETWQAENSFYVENGKVYDIRVRDALLWESEEHVVERKDFPYPPPKVNHESETDGDADSSGLQDMAGTEQDDWEEVSDETLEKDKNTEEVSADDAEGETLAPHGKIHDLGDSYVSESEVGLDAGASVDGADSDTVMEKQSLTMELSENATDHEKSAQLIKLPWYTTTVGKTIIVSASTLALGSMIGGILLLYLFSLPVYCVEGKDVLRKLGRVLLHRTKEGYSVYLSEIMLQAAVVPKYRIKVSPILLKRVENARLLVESDEKNIEVLLQETIDFEL